jgi:hypothetical protein
MAEVTLQSRNRADLVRRGRYLEYFTIGYNSLEGLIAVAAGLLAALVMVPIIVKEGIEGLRGETCCDDECH